MSYTYNQNVRIHYEVQGDGPPLFLHHALSDSLEGWQDGGWIESLQHHYRLILMDARGHGASDRPHEARAYTLGKRVGDVVAVLDHLGLRRVHYLGYSLGGWVGFGLARLAPERLRSLIIGGGHPYAEDMSRFRQGLQDGLASWVALLGAYTPLPVAVKERMLRNDLQALQASVAADRPDLSGMLPALQIPSLLIVGEADPRSRYVQRAATEMPDAQLHIMPGLNHSQTFLQSEKILPQILDFLEEVERNEAVGEFRSTVTEGSLP